MRGVGLWRGIQLTAPAAAHVQTRAAEAGFLVNAVTPEVVRLAPPLIITRAEILEFTRALPDILNAAARDAEEDQRR